MITDTAKAEIIAHAKEDFPNECCGLVIKDANNVITTQRVKNLAQVPAESFAIDPEVVYLAEKDGKTVVAIYHSHPNQDSKPSTDDILASEELDLPYFIVGLPEIDFSVYTPKGMNVELLGRPFLYGLYDCWTLCRDKLHQEYPNLRFPIAPYRELGWWQDPSNADFYRDCLTSLGNFVDITVDFVNKKKKLQKNDLILMQLKSDVANHLGIYEEDGQFMHHVADRKSCLENYGGMWEKNTKHILRHQTLL